MSEQNVEIVRRAYDAWDRGGTEAVLDFLDPQIEFMPVEENIVIRGHDAYRSYYEEWHREWEDFSLKVEDAVAAADRVLCTFYVNARAKQSGIEIAGRFFHVITIRNGKGVRIEKFADRSEALEAVGLPQQDAHADP